MSDQATRDEHAAASYAYSEALMAYEDVLVSRDPARRASAEAHLNSAARRLSGAQSALVAARRNHRVATFATVLGDPTQQLDPEGEVWASVVAYQAATSDTPSARP